MDTGCKQNGVVDWWPLQMCLMVYCCWSWFHNQQVFLYPYRDTHQPGADLEESREIWWIATNRTSRTRAGGVGSHDWSIGKGRADWPRGGVEEAATWTEAEREKKELRQEEKIVGKRGKMVIETCSGYHEEMCVGGEWSEIFTRTYVNSSLKRKLNLLYSWKIAHFSTTALSVRYGSQLT
jgi:hypothetical protein